MIKALIFDMDGLLVDSEHIYHDGWLAAGQKNGIKLNSTEIRKWSGQGIKESQRKLKIMIKDSNLVRKIKEDRELYIIEQLNANKIHMKPFALEVLIKARSLKIKCGIASSSNRVRAEKFIKYFDLAKMIDFATFGDEVNKTKPDPEIYLKSLNKAKVSADEAFAVEDSLPGAKAATAAGLSLFLVPDQSLNVIYSEIEKKDLNIFEEGISLEVVLNYLNKSEKDYLLR